MATNIIAAADARFNFFELLEKLRQVFTITKRGTAKAVIMSADEFEEWAETLEIASNPKTVKGIKKGLKEIRSGKHLKHGDVFKTR
jgi:prevent-host-death family protein